MGCSSSKSAPTIDDTKGPVSANCLLPVSLSLCLTAASEDFTIPLDTEQQPEMPLNETLRQPPKRIQQLMQEAAHLEPPTLEELEDKQQKAEQRRQELMQQKLDAIQKNVQILMRGQSEGDGHGEANTE
ncbi:uncharacterized protein LOC117192901 [Drosophila miranda]|uniref:uncharacterized protein LOC117192901 n=1 Tax=Drosophila miranda TaxID=7229 RepID=UPI00143F0C33|nr:uncharacterized protein LOC117192901 [Drosophila miranda]